MARSEDVVRVALGPSVDECPGPGERLGGGLAFIQVELGLGQIQPDLGSCHVSHRRPALVARGLLEPRSRVAPLAQEQLCPPEERLGQGHNSEDVPGKIPVYVAYFTAWPDADGKVGYFADIYKRDQRLAKALSATENVRTPSS